VRRGVNVLAEQVKNYLTFLKLLMNSLHPIKLPFGPLDGKGLVYADI
jgi:hypothetical protein